MKIWEPESAKRIRNGAAPIGAHMTFALEGVSIPLDHRIHAYRDDVADIALAGTVLSHYFAIPEQRMGNRPVTPILDSPGSAGTMTSQLLLGETFSLVDTTEEWAWGYSTHDHYVGYIEASALSPFGDVSHIVCADGHGLPYGCRIASDGSDGLLPIGEALDDPAAIAEMLVGTPYVWGGRTSTGIDCSGLVQLAYAMCGHVIPRDTDLQEAAIDVTVSDGDPLRRGDLVYFPDHVGIMADEAQLVHATQHYGETVIEPLADVVARIGETHENPVTSRKRLL